MEYIIVVALVSAGTVWAGYTEEEAQVFMAEYSTKSRELWSIKAYKEWDYDMSLSDEAAKESEEAAETYNNYQAEVYPEIMKYQWKDFQNESLKRQFKFVSYLDEAALSKDKRANLSQIQNKMLDIYNSAQVKEFNSPDNKPSLYIEDIAQKFADNYLNAEEMAYYWTEWHNTVGRPEKEYFAQWIALENEVAILNDFKNNAERWHKDFETKNFEKEMCRLFKRIEPFFKELHAYIRYKLWIAHSKNSTLIDPEGPIPACLLGNMWGLDGIGIYDITAPYPNKQPLDASAQLAAQNYTGLKMAKTAEEFYVSLGMDNMTKSFWDYSIFERKGEMDCGPVAFNFFNGYDYRIHFCTSPIQDHFGRMHHEMGHCVNYMLHKNQPFWFDDAPNPGFDEAIGDLMYIYATSPNYLKKRGLIDADIVLDKEQVINAIFISALADAFFWPYAYSLDVWRWDVMKGKIIPDNYNCEYWKRRIDLHGVEPPVYRDETDFDPGAKYHVIAGDQYISYFVSAILKYQFLKSLCVTSGYYDPQNPTDDKPLVFCDIYNSKPVGDKLKKMMALGKSRPWPDALEVLTGEREMDAAPLLEFYKPLYEWLKKENKKNHVRPGWNKGRNRCNLKKKCTSGERKMK